MLAPQLVIFDLDGCIVDSISGAVSAHVRSLKDIGIAVGEAEVNAALGANASETLSSLARRVPRVAEVLADPGRYAKLRDANSELLMAAAEPLYLVARDLIARLRADGCKLGIVTTRSGLRARRTIEHCGLDQAFPADFIVSSDTPGLRPKSSGDGIRHLMARAGISDSRAVLYIGDREADRVEARAANVSFFSAGWSKSLHFTPPAPVDAIGSLLDAWQLGIVSTTSPAVLELERHLRDKRLSVFVGAGFSMDAGFDDWDALVERLLGAPTSDLEPGSLPDLIQRYVDEKRDLGLKKIDQELTEALARRGPPLRKHKLLAQLGLPRIWTTNFDSLIEDAFAASVASGGSGAVLIASDASLVPPGSQPDSRTQVLKVNGSLVSEYSSLVFSTESFERQIEDRRELLREFHSELVSKSVLFLGTSFEDPLMSHLLAELRRTADRRPAIPVHYTARPPEKSALKARLQGYGVEMIEIPDWRGVEALLAELKWRSRPHRVVVSGSLPGAPTQDQHDFLTALGYGLVAAGFRIHFGNGPGVSEPLVEGAKAAADLRDPHYHREAIVRFSRVLEERDLVTDAKGLTEDGRRRLARLILPWGARIFVVPTPGEDAYDSMRREMMRGTDVCIAVGGGEASEGMSYEQQLAESLRIPYVPVPYLAGHSASEWERRRHAKFVAYGDARLRALLAMCGSPDNPLAAARAAIAAAIAACLC